MSEIGDQRKDGFSRTFDEGGKVQIGQTFPFLIFRGLVENETGCSLERASLHSTRKSRQTPESRKSPFSRLSRTSRDTLLFSSSSPKLTEFHCLIPICSRARLQTISSYVSFLRSFVRKNCAQGVVDLGDGRACRKGPRNRIEQREVVDRSQIPGGSHRNACCHQLVGIGFAFVAHDIILAGQDEC
jgi:hypothetical protein